MRTLTTLAAVLLTAAILTACNGVDDDCQALTIPAPAAQIAPQVAPERPSGGTSGGGRSSSSRGGSSSSSSKHRPAHKGTSSSGGSGGVHVDIDHDCDDD
ncbi:hypothetical protein ABZ690_34300 [Streptomyces sp. NPDC006967]|uniref:hypothetical protein n=1 Tax=Streptomyces sp. NPDC006967 TaxID=3156906 RepID=UPI0033F6A35E